MKESLFKKITRSNIVYFNGKTVKDKNFKEECSYFNIFDNIEKKVRVDFWDDKNRILSLKSKY